MKIVYLNYHIRSITGGHKYNDAFLDYVSKITDATIIRTPCCAALYPSWLKPLSPLLELKRLKLLSRDSIVFWGDTSHNYHFLLALFARFFMRVKSVIIVHHFLYGDESKHKIQSLIYFYYLKQIKTIIVPSPYTMSLAKRYFPEKEIIYIPLPFMKGYCLSTTYEEGNYLYVGSVEPRKGLIYLIEALGIVKQQKPTIRFTLTIVGEIVDIDYANLLLNKAEELNIREHVVVRGRVSDDELNDCYQRAEIFTFPSLLEGYGVVLIEAFSKGVPVVCFNNSAMPYTVKDGVNGLVADNMNIHSLADKILQLSGNQVLRKKLQEGIALTMKDLKTRDDFEAGVRKLFYALYHGKQIFN